VSGAAQALLSKIGTAFDQEQERVCVHHNAECVIEQWCGLFVAAYVTELAGAFYGYAKIYQSEPQDAWSANALMKVSSAACPCPVEALDSALERAFAAVVTVYDAYTQSMWRQAA
jgi:hypothetical protein